MKCIINSEQAKAQPLLYLTSAEFTLLSPSSLEKLPEAAFSRPLLHFRPLALLWSSSGSSPASRPARGSCPHSGLGTFLPVGSPLPGDFVHYQGFSCDLYLRTPQFPSLSLKVSPGEVPGSLLGTQTARPYPDFLTRIHSLTRSRCFEHKHKLGSTSLLAIRTSHCSSSSACSR